LPGAAQYYCLADYAPLFVQSAYPVLRHTGSSSIEGGKRIPKYFAQFQLLRKSVPRDLFYRPQRTPAQANRCRRSCKALTTNYAGFGGSSIFHYDDKRNQTPVREIRKFYLSTRLVKDSMVWQVDIFGVRTQ
jgi:hypothetical protein